MEIYVVQQGDTITSIAQKYGISSDRLIIDNGITSPYSLAVGQTLVITKPTAVYIVKDGDTLEGIAAAHEVTVMQLLRNNPWLAEREYIYPGETIVISYDNNMGNLMVAGYCYPFISDVTLRMTLPYLTYLVVFNYRMTIEGNLNGSYDDIAVVETAKAFGVGSTLVVTTFSVTGEANPEAEYEILRNPELQKKIANNLLAIVEEKGYVGVNMAFQFINTSTQQYYLDFLTNVSNVLHPAGYSVYLTLNPGINFTGTELVFERINYEAFAEQCEGILFLSYSWGTTTSPPIEYSIASLLPFLEYILSQMPVEKIRIALPTIAYDWQLPYIVGESRANALNYSSAISLAVQTNSIIRYDEASLSAYFVYNDLLGKSHIVWLKDARSIDSSIKILRSYGIEDYGIWNIMYYFHQLWLVINTQYEISKP